jgi:hypothetical protein
MKKRIGRKILLKEKRGVFLEWAGRISDEVGNWKVCLEG